MFNISLFCAGEWADWQVRDERGEPINSGHLFCRPPPNNFTGASSDCHILSAATAEEQRNVSIKRMLHQWQGNPKSKRTTHSPHLNLCRLRGGGPTLSPLSCIAHFLVDQFNGRNSKEWNAGTAFAFAFKIRINPSSVCRIARSL